MNTQVDPHVALASAKTPVQNSGGPDLHFGGYHSGRVRAGVERCVAMAMLLGLSPVMLAVALAVRLSSKGPAVYRQVRLSQSGKPFDIFKFRTMGIDAEKGTGAVWSGKNDPRITRVGYWLRKLHLDELPQLLNIARGEMRFVGPRPERPEIAGELCHQIPGYAQRVAVLPGLTGLAQVNLPPDETVECVKRKFELDMEYVYTASPGLDLRLVFATALKMTGMPHAVIAKIALVKRDPRSKLDRKTPISLAGRSNSPHPPSRLQLKAS